MWRRWAVVLSVLAALAAVAVWRNRPSDGPAGKASNRRPFSSLFVQPSGRSTEACGEYVATWLDLLHAEDASPINELKADLGQGPMWVAVTEIWGEALDLEGSMPREDVARRLAPRIATACEDADVRAEFLQLQSS